MGEHEKTPYNRLSEALSELSERRPRHLGLMIVREFETIYPDYEDNKNFNSLLLAFEKLKPKERMSFYDFVHEIVESKKEDDPIGYRMSLDLLDCIHNYVFL